MSDRRFAAEQARYRAESRVYISDRYASRRRPKLPALNGAGGGSAHIQSSADNSMFI